MRNDSIAEKSVARAQAGPIVKLRRQQNIPRGVSFLQTANRANRNYPAHVEGAQCVNIRAMIQLVRQNPVAAPVSRQKINLASANFSADQRVRRRSKRRVDLMLGRIEQLLHLIYSAAANDADRWKFILHSQPD